jgi:sugar-specific transcriptional regulator TrmB
MQNDLQLAQRLREIGLSEKAAAVYAAVLEFGVAYPSKIAEVTKLNRTTVYHILADLTIKGLVSELERGKKLSYQVEKPARLVSFTKSQIRLAEERAERAEKLLPDIEGLFAGLPIKPRVRFFEGKEGVLAVLEDHVAEKTSYEMVSFSNVETLIPQLPARFVADYVKQKQRIGITTRAIFPDTEFSTAYDKQVYGGIEKKYQVDARFISAKTFPYQGDLTVYGTNKVSIINFQENVLIGVIIEDATVAGMMRMIFELAWKGTGSR